MGEFLYQEIKNAIIFLTRGLETAHSFNWDLNQWVTRVYPFGQGQTDQMVEEAHTSRMIVLLM
jgi:hypothetical protein